VTCTIRLRAVRAEDEPFLYEVYASTRTEELAVVPWTAEQKDAFLRMQFAAQHTHYRDPAYYPNPTFLVVELDGDPAGRLYLHRSAGELLIVDIALLPEYRGQGVGTRLMRDLVVEADESGATVRLHVEPWNPAVRLYERLGFRCSGEGGIYQPMERPPQGERHD